MKEYSEELQKFIKKQVRVVDMFGVVHEGECRAISEPHLNVVIMTKTEKILIKNIVSITRLRDFHR